MVPEGSHVRSVYLHPENGVCSTDISGKLLVDRLFFYAAERKKKPWHVIVVVDQSGSMLESAIFSAVMASIFAELPAVKTSLVLFDTQVVDLSDQVGQPVDVLLSIQR